MILEEVKKIVSEELSVAVEELSADTKFIEDLGADSLDLFQLAMAMEEKFDIEIPSEDLEKIATVGDAVKYVEEKQA